MRTIKPPLLDKEMPPPGIRKTCAKCGAVKETTGHESPRFCIADWGQEMGGYHGIGEEMPGADPICYEADFEYDPAKIYRWHIKCECRDWITINGPDCANSYYIPQPSVPRQPNWFARLLGAKPVENKNQYSPSDLLRRITSEISRTHYKLFEAEVANRPYERHCMPEDVEIRERNREVIRDCKVNLDKLVPLRLTFEGVIHKMTDDSLTQYQQQEFKLPDKDLSPVDELEYLVMAYQDMIGLRPNVDQNVCSGNESVHGDIKAINKQV